VDKRDVRATVLTSGDLVVEDPSPLEAALLGRLGLRFPAWSPGSWLAGRRPRFLLLRAARVAEPLPCGERGVLALHQRAVDRALQAGADGSTGGTAAQSGKGGLAVLDLKQELLRRLLWDCRLCGLGCGGAADWCPALRPARYYQHYVHLAEEREIGPTLALELAGCSLQCCFCHKGETLIEDHGAFAPLNPSLWEEICSYPPGSFATISFLGGNPDQSLAGVLNLLAGAPAAGPHWPVVWHTNGYSSPLLYELLRGVVDLWVFDFKYFSNRCASALSRGRDYVGTAIRALAAICQRDPSVPVIVRHLLLPGHEKCCQDPLVEHLAGHWRDRILFHPMGQYVPAWKVRPGRGPLGRPVPPVRVAELAAQAGRAGLRLGRAVGVRGGGCQC